MTWWLEGGSRLDEEKLKLVEFESEVDWLKLGNFYAKADLTMCLDFEIIHNSINYELILKFPSVFPDTPPMIFTKNGERISGHQYGAQGELCLEYRPDNWNPSITAADMVSSCYRLLDEEHPNQKEVVHAHSAHTSSLGRDLRSKFCRLLMNEDCINILNTLGENSPVKITVKQKFSPGSFVSLIDNIGDEESLIWSSELDIPGSTSNSGWVIHAPNEEIPKVITFDFLNPFLVKFCSEDICKSVFDSDDIVNILLGNINYWSMVRIYGKKDDRKILTFSTVSIPEDKQRNPEEFESLNAKKVGIVGCGSIGSKVSASLCRSGIINFVLIDEDIFFPANVIRNDLDLRNIGSHKANAIKERINSINPLCNVNSLCISLGGQESSASMSGALVALSECDIIVDATADPIAFTIIASIATRKQIPIIWSQVFAGGIGGYICRIRPEIDPTPLSARNQIQTWCDDQGVEWINNPDGKSYSGTNMEGEPMIAGDAEVSIIAAHTSRFVTDILARVDSSIFPQSVYLIGFTSDWVFDQPFSVFPLDLIPDDKWGETTEALSGKEMVDLLNEYLVKEADENAVIDPK